MADQYEFDWGGDERTIQQAFTEFDAAHPEVFDYLVKQSLDLHRRGWRHYGIGALWERMRWHFQVDQDLGEEFKLNNNYRSRYVRKLIAEYPVLDELFELRTLRAK